jgi:type I restriction enzyme S subunit
LNPDGVYPVISGGVKPMGMLDKKNRVKNSITVAQYGSAGVVLWQEEDFWANDVCYTFELGAGISERYLYHVLKSLQLSIDAMVNRDAVPYHLPRNVFETLLIPVPPLAEQAEIVSILDQFDTLTNSLTEGIPAEIELRQKQYEFYREKLLTF